MQHHIEIVIGARADKSIDTIFGNVPKQAAKAKTATERALNGSNSAGALKGQEQASERAARKMVADQSRAILQIARLREREERKAEAQRIASERRVAAEKEKALQLASRQEIKAQRDTQRLQERERTERQRAIDRQVRSQIALDRQRKQEAREQDRQAKSYEKSIAYRTGYHGIIRYAPAAINRGLRVANDIVRGAGVNFDLGSSVGRATSLNSAAVGLANQERLGTGKTRGTGFYDAAARKTGDELSIDPEKAVELMRAFTGRTGDFDVAIAKLSAFGSIAVASGADMGEFGSAAGFVFNQLKSLPDAGERTEAVMRGIVGQTAVGAVEMEEYAKQMGRIAANAHVMEGPIDKNILQMSAITQYVAEAGGGTGGADAARSLNSLMTTPQKGARMKAFNKYKVDLYTDMRPGHRTQLRNITDIMKDSIVKSGGDLPAMNQMWMDVLGAKAVKGLSGTYRDAFSSTKGTAKEKEAAGRAAIDEALNKYVRASLDKETEKANIDEHKNSIEGRAQAFQNNLDRVVASLAQNVLPQLEKAGPAILDFTQKLSDFISWAANNPWEAAGAAVALGLGRAVVESVARAGIEAGMGAIFAAIRSKVQSDGLSAFGMQAGGGGLALSIAGAVAITAASVAITEAAELKKDTGTKSWLGMLPGFTGEGGFKGWGALWDEANTPAGELFKRKADENMNAQARAGNLNAQEWAAYKAQHPEYKSGGGVGVQQRPEAVPANTNTGPMPVVIDPAQMQGAFVGGFRSLGTIPVLITNLPSTPDAPPMVSDKGRAAPF